LIANLLSFGQQTNAVWCRNVQKLNEVQIIELLIAVPENMKKLEFQISLRPFTWKS
jgi:hypothetical protein